MHLSKYAYISGIEPLLYKESWKENGKLLEELDGYFNEIAGYYLSKQEDLEITEEFKELTQSLRNYIAIPPEDEYEIEKLYDYVISILSLLSYFRSNCPSGVCPLDIVGSKYYSELLLPQALLASATIRITPKSLRLLYSICTKTGLGENGEFCALAKKLYNSVKEAFPCFE
jgi:hypothetical protein